MIGKEKECEDREYYSRITVTIRFLARLLEDAIEFSTPKTPSKDIKQLSRTLDSLDRTIIVIEKWTGVK